MKKIILDVDTGIDDAIAIMLAVASKSIEILGITVTSGNIHIDQGIINTKKILKVLGREDIKVYRGSESPIKRKLVDASHIHGKDGLSGQLSDVQVTPTDDGCAFNFIEESINAYKEDLTLIMTGPETNVSRLFRLKPYLKEVLKNVIAMGGAINLKGNTTLVGEFNIVTDPEAAYEMFHSDIENFTLLSLDVTRDALINKEDLTRIKDEKVRSVVAGLTEDYMDRYFLGNGSYSCLMHDPLTVLYFLNPSLVETKKAYVTVERTAEYTYGMTLCDLGNRLNKKPNIYISYNLAVEAFKDDFFHLLNQLDL